MKKINTTLTIISLVLLCTLVSFVGCSDMMATLGNVSLTIDLDTPEVEVASYILEGNLVDSNSRFTLNNIVPPRHTLSELKQGRWNLTVKAFDDQDNQIGIGTKAIDLRAGQVVDTSLLVVFGQSTPLASAFTIAGPSRNADREGTISGTTVKMEYRLASAAEDAPFTACTSGTTQLVPGTYHIRLAQAHGLQASECLTFTVPAYQKIQLTIAAPTLTTTKEYDGTSTVQGSITPGAPSGVRSGDEVVVHAQASYDSASVGNSKNITVAYSLSGADALNYTKPADTTIAGTISPKQLSISGTTVTTSKVYDGSTLATVESHGTLDGKVDGEVVTVTAHPVYQDRHAGTGKLINVSYTLGGTHAGNYRAPANTSFSGTITKSSLAVTYTTTPQPTKVYDGTATAQIATTGSPVGVITGDTVQLLTTATYDAPDAGSPKSGTISYALSGADANNYTAPANGTFSSGTITTRPLTVTGYNLTASKPYDGNTNASIGSVAFNGKIAADEVQVIATAAYDSATVSSEDLDKTITITYSLSGDDALNYLEPASSTADGTIVQKQLTVSGTDIASTKVYDGSTLATVESHGTLGGKVDGEVVTVTAHPVYQDRHAGTGKLINVSYTLGGTHAGNYLAPANANFVGEITPKALEVSGTSVQLSKVYDGSTTAVVTASGSPSNLVSGDAVTVHAQASYDSADANEGKTLTVTYSISGANAKNYTAPAPSTYGSTGTITKRQLTVTVGNHTKIYGQENPSFTVNISGFVNGESASTAGGYVAPTASTAATTTTDTGTYEISTSGGIATNYSFNTSDTGTLIINKATYDMSAVSFTGKTVTYNGTEQSLPISGTLPSGVTVSYTDNAKADAGTYTATAHFSGDATNYEAIADKSATFIISKAVLTATVGDHARTYGAANPEFPVSVLGFVNGETASTADSYVAPTASTSATTSTAVGTATITISGGSATNYSFNTSDTGTLTINKATYDMSAISFTDKTVTYNGTEQSLPISGTLPSGVTVSYTDNAKTDAGTYTATAHFSGDATNYEVIADKSALLIIEPITMTGSVTLTGSWTYGETLTAVPTLTNAGPAPTYIWIRNGGLIAGATESTYTLTEADIGYSIKVAINATAGNYKGQVVSTAANISKAAGSALSGTFEAYYPIISASQTNITQNIINLIGFTANQTGIEASISTNGTTYGSYSSLEIDSRGRAMISVTSAQKIKLRYEATSTHYAGADLLLTVGEKDLAIGDYYAGGVVGYIYQSTDTGYMTNQVHGLIAAKADTSTNGSKWSSNNTLRIGTGVGIGTGSTNTDAIILALDGSEIGMYGAKEARLYTNGGYNDWFLPSWHELLQLRNNKLLIGNFDTSNWSTYMSSSESTQSGWNPEPFYHAVYFDTNLNNYVWDKPAATHIRAVRYF